MLDKVRNDWAAESTATNSKLEEKIQGKIDPLQVRLTEGLQHI
jgi:hypothetical protein